jgi:hypothetical protein
MKYGIPMRMPMAATIANKMRKTTVFPKKSRSFSFPSVQSPQTPQTPARVIRDVKRSANAWMSPFGESIVAMVGAIMRVRSGPTTDIRLALFSASEYAIERYATSFSASWSSSTASRERT